MTLVLVPIPPHQVEGAWGYIKPYILKIAERAGNDPVHMENMLTSGDAQAFLVWDETTQKAQAFVGVQYERRGADLVGKMIWLMGENRAQWAHLFVDLETYLREHQKCVAVKAIARPGWTKSLKSHGYRITHHVMEKDF